MSVRIRLAKGVTWGRTGLRFSGHIGALRYSSGRSGTFLRAKLGPLLWNRTIR